MLTATVDDRGRILLPHVVRENMGLKPGDEVAFDFDRGRSMLGRYSYNVVKVEVKSVG